MRFALLTDCHYGFSFKTDRIYRYKFFPMLQAENPEVILISGDIAINQPKQTRRFLKLIREYFPSQKIIIVLGNHDFWDVKGEFDSIDKLLESVDKSCEEQEIIRLDGEQAFIKIENTDKLINIYGFNGWYVSRPTDTNDQYNIKNWLDADDYLRNKSRGDFVRALELAGCGHINICMTHFPSFTDNILYGKWCANPMYLDQICKYYDYYIVGHSHQQVDMKYPLGARMINVGSDYDKPRYKILDIG